MMEIIRDWGPTLVGILASVLFVFVQHKPLPPRKRLRERRRHVKVGKFYESKSYRRDEDQS